MNGSEALAGRHHTRRRRTLRSLHRGIGVAAAAFLLLLGVTGVALNHSTSLGLESILVAPDWLLERYGIEGPEFGQAFSVGQRWITLVGDRVYFDDRAVVGIDSGAISGAVSLGDEVIVAGPDQLWFLDSGGVLLERLPIDLPASATITAIAADLESMWLLASHTTTYRFDPRLALLELEPDPGLELAWSLPGVLPATLRRNIEESHRGQDLSLERVLLDLHSGRLFGWSGVLMMDLAALALVVLALSGALIWLRR